MAKTMNPNKPFVGKMKEQSGSYISGKSVRRLMRGALKSHNTMVRQSIATDIIVVGRLSNSHAKNVATKYIVKGVKTIWHDASAFKP